MLVFTKLLGNYFKAIESSGRSRRWTQSGANKREEVCMANHLFISSATSARTHTKNFARLA